MAGRHRTARHRTARPRTARRGPALASKLKVPRFVSLRFGTVYLRTGPGRKYPIDWVYKRRGLPVEVIRDFDTWRRVRDRWARWLDPCQQPDRPAHRADRRADGPAARATAGCRSRRRQGRSRRDRPIEEMRRRLVPDIRRRPYRLGPAHRRLGRPRQGRRPVGPPPVEMPVEMPEKEGDYPNPFPARNPSRESPPSFRAGSWRKAAAVVLQEVVGRHPGHAPRPDAAFPGQPVALAQVAGRAGGHDVFPLRPAAARARDDMVEGQRIGRVRHAAILAGELVRQEYN